MAIAFDVAGARAAGFSYDDIARSLAQRARFDLDGALAAGATVPEVIEFLTGQPLADIDEGPGVLEGFGAAGKAALYRSAAATAETIPRPVSSLTELPGRMFVGAARSVFGSDEPGVVDSLKEIGSGAVESWRARGQEAQQTFAEGTPDNYLGGLAYKAGGAFVQMLPAIAAGVITKNPNVAYAVMSVPAYSMAYEDAIASGASEADAQAAGIRQAIYEVGAEKIMGVFDAAGGAQTLKELAGVMLREAGSEVLTEEATLIDEALRGEDTGSTLEIAQRLFESGAIGAILGGGIAGTTMAANAPARRAEEKAKKEAEERKAAIEARRREAHERTLRMHEAYRQAVAEEGKLLSAQEDVGFAYSGSAGTAPITGESVSVMDHEQHIREFEERITGPERRAKMEAEHAEIRRQSRQLPPEQQVEVEQMLQRQAETFVRLQSVFDQPGLYRPERERVRSLGEQVGTKIGLFHVQQEGLGRGKLTTPAIRPRAGYNQLEEDLVNPNLDKIAAEVEADVGQEAAEAARASEKLRYAGAETPQAIKTFQRDSERREAERTEEAEEWASVARNPINIPFLKNAKNSPWRVTAINPKTGRVFAEHESGSVRMSLTWLLDDPNSVEPHAVYDERTEDVAWRHEFGKGRKSSIGIDAFESGQWSKAIPAAFKQQVDRAASEAIRKDNPNWNRKLDAEETKAEELRQKLGQRENKDATEAADSYPFIPYVGSVSTAQAKKAAKAEAVEQLRAANKRSKWRVTKEAVLKAEQEGLANLEKRKEEVVKRLSASLEEGDALDELRGIKPHEQDAGAQVKTYISKQARARIAQGASVSEDAWQVLPDGTVRKLIIRPEATKDPKNKKLEGMDAYVARPVSIGPNPIAEGEGPVVHVFNTKPNANTLAKIGESTTNAMKPATRIKNIREAALKAREAEKQTAPPAKKDDLVEVAEAKSNIASRKKKIKNAQAGTSGRAPASTTEAELEALRQTALEEPKTAELRELVGQRALSREESQDVVAAQAAEVKFEQELNRLLEPFFETNVKAFDIIQRAMDRGYQPHEIQALLKQAGLKREDFGDLIRDTRDVETGLSRGSYIQQTPKGARQQEAARKFIRKLIRSDLKSPEIIALTKLYGATIEALNPDVKEIQNITAEDLKSAYKATDSFINDVVWAIRNEQAAGQRQIPSMWEELDLSVARTFGVSPEIARDIITEAGLLPPAIERTVLALLERKIVRLDELEAFAAEQAERAKQSRFEKRAPGWAKAKAKLVRESKGLVPLERKSEAELGRTLPAEETKAPARERVALDQRLQDTIDRISQKTEQDIRTEAKERRALLELAYEAAGSKEGLSSEAIQKLEELRAQLRGKREQQTTVLKEGQEALRAQEEAAALKKLEEELEEIRQKAAAKDAELKAEWDRIRAEVEGVTGGLDAQGRPVWPEELTTLQQEILLETNASSPVTFPSLSKYEQIAPGVFAPVGTLVDTQKARAAREQEVRNKERAKKAEADLQKALDSRFKYKNPTDSLMPDRLRRKKHRRMVAQPKAPKSVEVTAASWEVTPLTKSSLNETMKYLGKAVTPNVILDHAYRLQSDPNFLAARREAMPDSEWKRINDEAPPITAAEIVEATQTIEIGAFSPLLQSIWVGSRAQEALKRFWETHPRAAAWDRRFRRMGPSRTASLGVLGKTEAKFTVRAHDLLMGQQQTQINAMSRSWAIARRYMKDAGWERTNADHNAAINAYLEGTNNVQSIEKTFGFRIPTEALPHLSDIRQQILTLAKLGAANGAFRKEETRGAINGGRFYLHHFANLELAEETGKKGLRHLPIAATEIIELARHSWHLPTTAAEVDSMSRSQLSNLINNSQHGIFRDRLGISKQDTATEATNVLVGMDANGAAKWDFGKPGELKTISLANMKKAIKAAPKSQQARIKEEQTRAMREFVKANLPTDAVVERAIDAMLQLAAPSAEFKLKGGFGSRQSITRERQLFLSQREMVKDAYTDITYTLNKQQLEEFEKDWEANKATYQDMTVDGFLQEMENKYPAHAEGIKAARKTQKFNQLLRTALGEVVDTESVVNATVEALAATVLTSGYVSNVLGMGNGRFMSVRGEALEDGSVVPPDWVPLAPENSALGRTTIWHGTKNGDPQFVAAHEILVPPEMAEFVKIQFDIDAGVERGPVVRWGYRLSGITKYGLVLVNPLAHIRNGISTGMIAMSNHIVGLGMGRALKYGAMYTNTVAQEALSETTESLAQEAKSIEMQTLEKAMSDRRVLYDGGRLGALLDVRKEGSGLGGTATFFQTRARNKARRVQYATEEAFRMEDEAVKVPAFLSNTAERLTLMGHDAGLIDQYLAQELMTAEDKALVEEAFDFAAEVVADTYPTFSRAAHIIKMLSRSPILGAFPTFTYEMIRTSVWSFKNDLNLMRGRMYDGKKVAEGQRAKAMMLGTARMSAKIALWNAAVVVQQAVMDLALEWWDDDEDDGLLDLAVDALAGRVGRTRSQEIQRAALPFFQRDTMATITDINPESYTVRTLGYAMPTGGIEDAMMRNMTTAWRLYANGSINEWEAANTAIFKTIGDIWLNEEVLLGNILSRFQQGQYRPKNTKGERIIFTPEDASIHRKSGDLLEHLARTLTPGAALDDLTGSLAGGIGESLPWNTLVSQGEDFIGFVEKLLNTDGLPDSEVRRAETLIGGMAHALGWKTKQVTLPDWAKQWDRDARVFTEYTKAMKTDLLIEDDDTYEAFAARFHVYNEERKHLFKQLNNSIAFALGPWQQDPAAVLDALKEANRVKSVAGVPLDEIIRGDYIPPTPTEFWEHIFDTYHETEGSQEGKTVARSTEELYKFYQWYVRAYETEGYDQIDY